MQEALRIIISKSRKATSNALQCIQAIGINSPTAQHRYNQVAQMAFSDKDANFTDEERALIASHIDSASNTRDYDIRVRVSATEKDTVQQMAKEAGQTVSDFIREKVGL